MITGDSQLRWVGPEKGVIQLATAVVIRGGCYLPPTTAGHRATMRPESLAAYAFPDGPAWRDAAATALRG
jgi:hypothetical protein